jgi:outer membrane protein OmpA-like peptidoglycan-associated protein
LKRIFGNSFPSQFGFIVLASALGLPAVAQEAQPSSNPVPQTTPAVATDQSSPNASPKAQVPAAREGFWGRVNPFARKKWVKKQIDPLNDRLTELDQVNARNGSAIEDVNSRAQSGIHRAQTAAEAAQQAAAAADAQARAAGSTAAGAQDKVNGLNSTVAGLDNYRQTGEVVVEFRAGSPVLTAAAKAKLDEFAKTLAGRQGYLLAIEGRAPQAGTAGIEASGKLTEAVRRYLVTEHEIAVFRLRSVGLGNASQGTDERVRTRTVRVRLMENSLAARGDASPHDATPANGAERP